MGYECKFPLPLVQMLIRPVTHVGRGAGVQLLRHIDQSVLPQVGMGTVVYTLQKESSAFTVHKNFTQDARCNFPRD